MHLGSVKYTVEFDEGPKHLGNVQVLRYKEVPPTGQGEYDK